MIQKFRKLSLESQLFLSFMAVSICLLLLSLSITLFSTITRQRQEIDKNISALASYIASMDNVISMLENGYPDDSAIEELIPCPKTFPTSTSSPSTTPTVSAFITRTVRRPARPSSAARKKRS